MNNMFYFDWRTWWTMVRLVRREQDPSRRRRQYRTLCVVVPALAVLHAVTFALDPIVFPALRRTEVRGPVFVVGHARSGTTYLHRMMANDPRFSYVLLWVMFFPSLYTSTSASVNVRCLPGSSTRTNRPWTLLPLLLEPANAFGKPCKSGSTLG